MATIIVSREARVFRNRKEAGRMLVEYLRDLIAQDDLVLAIPRGGVVVGGEIARAIGCELDVLIVRKLGAPFSPELAIGAVIEGAEKPYLNESIIRDLGISQRFIEEETNRQREEAALRAQKYRKARPKSSVEGRTVLLVDDGIATGATMISSIRGVKMQQPQSIVAALPVGPPDGVRQIASMVDDLVCLSTPPFFGAVGQFYEDFGQTSDSEVIEILKEFSPAGYAGTK